METGAFSMEINAHTLIHPLYQLHTVTLAPSDRPLTPVSRDVVASPPRDFCPEARAGCWLDHSPPRPSPRTVSSRDADASLGPKSLPLPLPRAARAGRDAVACGAASGSVSRDAAVWTARSGRWVPPASSAPETDASRDAAFSASRSLRPRASRDVVSSGEQERRLRSPRPRACRDAVSFPGAASSPSSPSGTRAALLEREKGLRTRVKLLKLTLIVLMIINT